MIVLPWCALEIMLVVEVQWFRQGTFPTDANLSGEGPGAAILPVTPGAMVLPEVGKMESWISVFLPSPRGQALVMLHLRSSS